MKNGYRKFPKKGKIRKFIFQNDSVKIDWNIVNVKIRKEKKNESSGKK